MQGAEARVTGGNVTKRLDVKLTGLTKFINSGKRRLAGLASSDSLDRQGDIVEPSGATWALPIPVLWAHKHEFPIGWVRNLTKRGNGLWVELELAEGIPKADEVWALIEAGLAGSYSIGFSASEWQPLAGGGKRFTKWELMEISVVVIPANPDARIQRNVTHSSDTAIALLKGTR